MSLAFHDIAFSEQQAYHEYLQTCPQITSDYSFINLWAWAEVYGLKWAWTDSLIWIRQYLPSVKYWAPVGNWRNMVWQEVFSNHRQLSSELIRVPERLAVDLKETFGDMVQVMDDRDQWDYIYPVEDLIHLQGKRFHKKKNLVNQFRKKYDYRYVPMTSALKDQAMRLQDQWCTWRQCDSDLQLANENTAISKVLSQWENLSGIVGGCLFVDSEMAAYTIGEGISPQMMVVHFEKGRTDFKGVYQAVNQLFLENQATDVKWVNREQDLGDEGLRKAKLSYHPERFLKKYRVNFLREHQ